MARSRVVKIAKAKIWGRDGGSRAAGKLIFEHSEKEVSDCTASRNEGIQQIDAKAFIASPHDHSESDLSKCRELFQIYNHKR